MKKISISIMMAVLLAALTGICIYKKNHVKIYTDENGQNVSIIGGADRPTAIILAGKLNGKRRERT